MRLATGRALDLDAAARGDGHQPARRWARSTRKIYFTERPGTGDPPISRSTPAFPHSPDDRRIYFTGRPGTGDPPISRYTPAFPYTPKTADSEVQMTCMSLGILRRPASAFWP